jgi:methionyl-tRNA formyltransferase
MGTPEFALPSFEALAAVSDLVGVVSQPDKPRGRGLAPLPSPVAAAALARGTPLVRPAKLTEARPVLETWRPDVIVVVAYGKILPRAILELPRLAPINIHASLLPRHRGAAPIAAAILAGDVETGITVMRMSEAMDAGDVLAQLPLAIEPEDTAASLGRRLALLGGRALTEALAELRGRGLVPTPQDPSRVTYAPRLTKEEGRIRWSEPAATIARKVRAYAPWPSAFTMLGGRTVKILRARVAGTGAAGVAPGTVTAVGDAIAVATGDAALELLELQAEGRKPLAARAFAAGARVAAGVRFDD